MTLHPTLSEIENHDQLRFSVVLHWNTATTSYEQTFLIGFLYGAAALAFNDSALRDELTFLARVLLDREGLRDGK